PPPRDGPHDSTSPAGRSRPPAAGPGPRLHRPHRPALPTPPGGRPPHHRPPHRRQPPAHRRRPRPRPQDQLPARPLRRLLVRPAAGLPALRLRPPSPRAGRPRHARRRRHGREPPRPPRLRQGPPPRPGPLLPLLHGLALRPQMGRPGGAGPPPLRLPPLGPPVLIDLYRSE